MQRRRCSFWWWWCSRVVSAALGAVLEWTMHAPVEERGFGNRSSSKTDTKLGFWTLWVGTSQGDAATQSGVGSDQVKYFSLGRESGEVVLKETAGTWRHHRLPRPHQFESNHPTTPALHPRPPPFIQVVHTSPSHHENANLGIGSMPVRQQPTPFANITTPHNNPLSPIDSTPPRCPPSPQYPPVAIDATTSSTSGEDHRLEVMLETAEAEFDRQFRAWKAHAAKVHDADDCHGIRVVVAHGVTPAMLEAISYKCLVGLTYELSADGVLVLMDVEGKEHQNAKGAAVGFVKTFVNEQRNNANRLKARSEVASVYGNDKLVPDVMLKGFTQPPADGHPQQQLEQPLVVVRVEVYHLDVMGIIDEARQYLSASHVQRVVAFKFFRAEPEGLESNPRVLKKPALAVVFERVGVARPGAPTPIGVVDEVSFGNASLDRNVLERLSTVPSRTSPAGLIRPIAASPLEGVQIETRDVYASFEQMNPHHLAVAVDAPGITTPLLFDLTSIFQDAVDDWEKDDRG